MRRRLKQGRIAPRVAAVVLLLAAVCGCEKETVPPKEKASPPSSEKKVPAPLSRTQDPAYTQALHAVRAKRGEVAAERYKVVAQMEKVIARARAALPAGATDEQVREELLGNPKKYPQWQALTRMLNERNAAAESELKDARRLVMARIRQEQEEFSKRGGNK